MSNSPRNVYQPKKMLIPFSSLEGYSSSPLTNWLNSTVLGAGSASTKLYLRSIDVRLNHPGHEICNQNFPHFHHHLHSKDTNTTACFTCVFFSSSFNFYFLVIFLASSRHLLSNLFAPASLPPHRLIATLSSSSARPAKFKAPMPCIFWPAYSASDVSFPPLCLHSNKQRIDH
ncbi:hypothetical protein CLIB1423_45S00188 [[Candida] railenensis]|uniref:Uncharacterized protein n=1 Tax=[Candida] railenensis TaxID=45579 RepID=A0A9P0W1I3_9ASCO|nr:hypothetical protein CLIB1423_45S00188 [[Candida] railenensis]